VKTTNVNVIVMIVCSTIWRTRQAPGPQRYPVDPGVDRDCRRIATQIEQQRRRTDDPKRRSDVAPEAVPLVPEHPVSLSIALRRSC